MFLDTEDASEGETGKKDREFTGIKEQYVAYIFIDNLLCICTRVVNFTEFWKYKLKPVSYNVYKFHSNSLLNFHSNLLLFSGAMLNTSYFA